MPQIDPSDLDAMRAKIIAAERERCIRVIRESVSEQGEYARSLGQHIVRLIQSK